jgi:hypothetical protein
MVTVVNAVSANAYAPILVKDRLFGNVTVDNTLQLLNAPIPIRVTESGMVTVVNLV